MMLLLAQYMPFRDPLWGGWNYWWIMLLPLAMGVALVYKAVRCEHLHEVPRQTARAFLKFVISFTLLAAALWLIVLFLERKG